MSYLYNYFFGSNVANYVEVGFSEEEAKAMSWIADQKPKGKCIGLATGAFLAFSWGHWHEIITSYLRFTWNKRFTQFYIIAFAVAFGDYWYAGKRKGADQVFTNKIFVNNNLFTKNIQSLVDNFNVLNRKFTQQEISVFNDRATIVRSNVDVNERKWIFNPYMQTQQQFERRIKLATTAPWKDSHIANTIKYENLDRQTKELRLAPVNMAQIIDNKGDKLGVANELSPFWTPLK